MATLIGAGGHAVDIAHTIDFARCFPHHSQFVDDDGKIVIGVNDPRLRAEIARELNVPDSSWVHPAAWVGPECSLGVGTHVNYGAAMTRTRIGRHTTISPGVTICGDVVIGDRVLIGAGATICEKVWIDDDVTVGAGAVVTPGEWTDDRQIDYHRITPGTWVGVPAKKL
jgi:carbonic anhydrase/acetyltransferase-like protein (isoleucine patch superfamily)